MPPPSLALDGMVFELLIPGMPPGSSVQAACAVERAANETTKSSASGVLMPRLSANEAIIVGEQHASNLPPQSEALDVPLIALMVKFVNFGIESHLLDILHRANLWQRCSPFAGASQPPTSKPTARDGWLVSHCI